MRNFKKSISVLLCIFMLIPFALSIASAAVFESKATENVTSDNTIDRNVSRWAYPRSSFIYQDGENMIIIRATDKVYVAKYNKDYQKLSEKNIDFELPLFGGFYSGEAFNYMVFGQTNTEESETKEVYRIVKYDKDFNKISHASIAGSQCLTVYPFDAGSLSMSESGNELTVHTSRECFATEDGVRHQSQFTIVLDTSTMSPTNNLTLYQANHVSHSFNQYVRYDNGARVLVDHGDAYPRSVVLSKYTGNTSSGNERYTEVSLFDIPGPTGANCTGVYVGGFEISENNYIVSINTVDHEKVTDYTNFNIEGLEADTRDAVLLISAKNNTSGSAVKKIYLTDYTDNNLHATAPYLVKLTDKWFAALWTEYKAIKKQSGNFVYHEFEDNGIKYVIVDENGNMLTDIKTASVTAKLSDCQPIFADNKIIWHYDDSSKRNICSLDISDELEGIAHVHTLKKVSAKISTCTIQGNNEYYQCSICGKCFKDASGTTATTVNDEKLSLASHQGGTATCTEKASCSVCYSPYGSTLPHITGEWIETKQPDCTNSGTKIKECTSCEKAVETGTLPAKGHIQGEWVVTEEPTTTSYGTKVRHCTVCKVLTSEQKIPMTGTHTVKDSASGIEIVYPENAYTGEVGILAYSYAAPELENTLKNHLGECKHKAYNIAVTVDGSQVMPNGAFTLRIPVPYGINADYAEVYFLNLTNGIPQKISAKLENGHFVIENATAGCFIIAEKETTLSLSASAFELKPGNSVQLIAHSNRTDIIFTSSNPSVANVDEHGNITAYANGTAVITVSVNGTDAKETCTVTVSQSFFEMIISVILNAFTELFRILNGLLG